MQSAKNVAVVPRVARSRSALLLPFPVRYRDESELFSSG